MNNSFSCPFSEDWFKEHIETSIADLGHRYTPKLNVELDISKKFDAICRNTAFKKQVKGAFHELLLAIKSVESPLHRLDFLQDHYKELISTRETLEEIYDSTQTSNLQKIKTELLQDACRSIGDIVNDCIAIINKKVDEDKSYEGNERHVLRRTEQAIYSFKSFIEGQYFDLANQPIMLLSGTAGIGKSHLLADIASNKIKEKKPCILLLGQQFISEDAPWTQILNNHVRLGFRSEDELLSELNAIAEKNNERVLFIIDAINEGQGCIFWPDYIKGFLRKILKYPWVGLVLSIRSSYEKLLTPIDLISSDDAIRVIHSGFSSVEYQASSHFFAQYRIEQPSIPLLHPEFSNPLFLKLFCEGLHRSGLSKIPKGYAGISSIINFFMDSIDKKLCMPKSFDYPCDQHLVRKVVDELIQYKFENNILLTIERLSKQLEEIQESYDLETRVEEKHRLEPIIDKRQKELEKEKEKAVGFSTREAILGNFIPYSIAVDIAETALAKFSNKRRFLDALISEGVLSKNLYWHADEKYEEGIYLAYERFEDHFTALHLLNKYQTQEQLKIAFSKGNELEHLITHHSKRGILEALSILIPERLGFELYELIDEDKRSSDAVMLTFINSLLWRKTETIKEKSIKYINDYILKYKGTFDEFFKLVYSVAADPDHPFNAESLHRYLMPLSMADRDAEWTTFLHQQNYEGFAMPRFINWALSECDKSYLSEESRLLASKALAWIFPSTNIPFRDSATEGLVNLLENNLLVATKLLMEFEKVNDPYVYERIFAAAYGAVLCSTDLNGLADLSQYIVDYLFKREDEVYPNVLVRDYARNIIEYALYKGLIELDDEEIIRPPYKSKFPDQFPSNEEIDAYKYDYNSDRFKDYYWGQNSILSSMTTEYGRGVGYGDFGRYTFQAKICAWSFDPNDLSNYACKLIFEEYGYDVEKHGEFDRGISHDSRHGNKIERIGKKYQWISLYEVMARLSDNHKLVDESTRWGADKNYIWYQGTWSPFIRNIDPTAKVFQPKSNSKKQKENWWNNFEYNEWELGKNDWLVSENSLLCNEQLITITDLTGMEWFVLESYQSWEEKIPIGTNKYEYPHKELWMMLKSVLVKDCDYNDLYSWMQKQHFMGGWFPEGRDNQYQVFCREYYWSPAYNFFNKAYYGGEQWEAVTEQYPSNKIVCEVSPTSEGHIWESGANSSDAPQYLAPRQHMFEGMKLEYSDNTGEWLDENGNLACFDPSITSDESSCLLVRKDLFQKYLDDNKLKIIWTILGEKQISGTMYNRRQYPRGIEFSGVFILNNNNIEGGLTKIVK